MNKEKKLFENLSKEAEEFAKEMNNDFEGEELLKELSKEAEEFKKKINDDFEKESKRKD